MLNIAKSYCTKKLMNVFGFHPCGAEIGSEKFYFIDIFCIDFKLDDKMLSRSFRCPIVLNTFENWY